MTLSKENYNKLDENYLYKREPIWRESNGQRSTERTYWCKNWTFKVSKNEDGRAFMRDTYFDSWDSQIEVTDENIEDFEFVFDFREVKRIRDSHVNEYNSEDLIYVATNSGGYHCGGCYWIKKTTEKSKELLIKKKREEIEFLKSSLDWAERDLNKLLE